MSGKDALLAELDALEHVSDDDAAYFLEVELQKIEIKELLRFEVMEGDGNLIEKAQRVLETGARHIMEGRPSSEFLLFVAHSIEKTLSGEEPSLDAAFRLKGKSQRPKGDLHENKAVIAYMDAMGEYQGSLSDSNLTFSELKKITKKTQNAALDKAYAAKWGATPQEHKASHIDQETIKKRRGTIKKNLQLLGVL